MSELKPSILKAKARGLLNGTYGFLALVVFAVQFFSYLLNMLLLMALPEVSNPFSYLLNLLFTLMITVIHYVLLAGLYQIFLKTRQGQPCRFGELFQPFTSHPEPIVLYGVAAFAVQFLSAYAFSDLFSAVVEQGQSPAVLTIVLLILGTLLDLWFSLTFSAVFVLYALHPEKSARDLLKDSYSLMKGFRLRYLWLQLTFAGLLLLGLLAFGFGIFLVQVYVKMTSVLFILQLIQKKEDTASDPM